MDVKSQCDVICNTDLDPSIKINALSVILKILENILNNPTMPKYRTISRHGNAYRTKVLLGDSSSENASVFENILLSAGFVYINSEGEACSQNIATSLRLPTNTLYKSLQTSRDHIYELANDLAKKFPRETQSSQALQSPEVNKATKMNTIQTSSSFSKDRNPTSLREASPDTSESSAAFQAEKEELKKLQEERLKMSSHAYVPSANTDEENKPSAQDQAQGFFSAVGSFFRSFTDPPSSGPTGSSNQTTQSSDRRTMTLSDLPRPPCCQRR